MSSTVRNLVGVVVGLAIVIPLVLLMFISPASKGTPHDLPIGVVGPQSAAESVDAMLDERQSGAFDVEAFADVDALRTAAENREVYGGFVLGGTPQTLIATGASPAVATMVTQIGAGVAAQSGAAPTVVDVAPAADDDPRGAGFGSMVMPVFMAGAALGAAAALVGRRRRIIAAVLPVGAALVAASAIGVATWIGVLSGGFALEWLALAAGILAIAAPVSGLVSLTGVRGIGVAALLFMLVGMPLAGIAAPPEFLPWIWGDLGQLLPLGATGTALRSAAFFDGAGAVAAWVVLAGWIVAGYLLLGVSRRRSHAAEHGTEQTVQTPELTPV
ncbi:ABC transporter permease [Gordonia sp. HY442]|uniref:ABC transporter permease n=1 Tax=Gordonia zhenghanii TaxID=2911516 RepID=UPI001F486A9E|nr:ABC transporter permease [Gordonia zhenghanii]MCF8604108.1 ABC transporter permease [Gordonia zhenghanii]